MALKFSKLKRLTCKIKETKTELSDYSFVYEAPNTNKMNVGTNPTTFHNEIRKKKIKESSRMKGGSPLTLNTQV